MEPEAANKQAELLIHGGARVIELGAASSHPDAKKISVEEELRRLKPALEGIRGGGTQKGGTGRESLQNLRGFLSKGSATLRHPKWR